jgi:hypothetical protein
MKVEGDFDLDRKLFDESEHQTVVRDAVKGKDFLEERLI